MLRHPMVPKVAESNAKALGATAGAGFAAGLAAWDQSEAEGASSIAPARMARRGDERCMNVRRMGGT